MAKAKPAKKGLPQRKQRTAEHRIEDLSENFIERLALLCGYTVERVRRDYGYDLFLVTYDENGYPDDELVRIQVKARSNLDRIRMKTQECFSLQIDARDYLAWSKAIFPVFIILYDAEQHEAYWLHVQAYTSEENDKIERDTVRLRIPRRNIVGIETMQMIRDIKETAIKVAQQALQ